MQERERERASCHLLHANNRHIIQCRAHFRFKNLNSAHSSASVGNLTCFLVRNTSASFPESIRGTYDVSISTEEHLSRSSMSKSPKSPTNASIELPTLSKESVDNRDRVER